MPPRRVSQHVSRRVRVPPRVRLHPHRVQRPRRRRPVSRRRRRIRADTVRPGRVKIPHLAMHRWRRRWYRATGILP